MLTTSIKSISLNYSRVNGCSIYENFNQFLNHFLFEWQCTNLPLFPLATDNHHQLDKYVIFIRDLFKTFHLPVRAVEPLPSIPHPTTITSGRSASCTCTPTGIPRLPGRPRRRPCRTCGRGCRRGAPWACWGPSGSNTCRPSASCTCR